MNQRQRHGARSVEGACAGVAMLGDARGARRHERGVQGRHGGPCGLMVDPVGSGSAVIMTPR